MTHGKKVFYSCIMFMYVIMYTTNFTYEYIAICAEKIVSESIRNLSDSKN